MEAFIISLKKWAVITAIALLAAMSCVTAYAQEPCMRASYSDTVVTVNTDGNAHVERQVFIADDSNDAIVVGALSLSLQKNTGLFGVHPAYKNITVTKQDGTLVQYTVTEESDRVRIDIFCTDALLPGWNIVLVIKYDVDGAAAKGLLADVFTMSGSMSGLKEGEMTLTVTLPEGSKVTHSSGGAEIIDNVLKWQGSQTKDISIEYSRLPLPTTPVPLQYVVWGLLASLVFVWGFMLKR